MSTLFGSVVRSLARSIDSRNASLALVDTDGKRPETHALEKRVNNVLSLFDKPLITHEDLTALESLKHLDALDDRKMLLESVLTKMARFSKFPISLTVQKAVIDLLFKDLPHPPVGFLSPYDITRTIIGSSQPDALTPPQMPRNVHYAFRAPDGSNYNPLIPGIGKVGSPYARSVPSTNLTPSTTLPDPELVFDVLLKREKFEAHPDGISSLFFAFADLVIHSIFNTDHGDWGINNTSSYLDLSVLYGNSEKELDGVRAYDGIGKLKADCFADVRLLMMPPASCALLILFNRNHNYVAQKLFDINEFGRFKDPSTLSPEKKRIQDDEIFHRTRLVNCGFFMQIILGDYVGAILGLVRAGYDWRLDPLMETRELDHSVSPRGQGNVCSIEFNLLYRWHATLSQSNAAWVEAEIAKELPQNMSVNSVEGFKKAAISILNKWNAVKPTDWTFAGLSRVDGKFKDTDLANILQGATKEVAGAFKARGIPECMRAVEVLGIVQSRRWGTCSLNEFRKFMGLKPYTKFSEWNPDPTVHKAAEALYRDIDRLELHVGLQAEETKKPGDGAGLCPGYTISRAILADAVCLTRGDRFLTTDFTPYNLTAWGWNDCQYDKEDGSYGGMLTKLLFRGLPDYYPTGSVLAHFPFTIPQKMFNTLSDRGDGSVNKYCWPIELEKQLADGVDALPAVPKSPYTWKTINSYEGVKKALTSEASRFTSNVVERQESTVELVLQQRKRKDSGIFRSIHAKQAAVTEAIVDAAKTEWFKKKTERLIQTKAFGKIGSEKPQYVDIVKDVINLLPIHWICEEITGIPLKYSEFKKSGTSLKDDGNPKGEIFEQQACDKFQDVARYIYVDSTPVDDFKYRERSQKYAQELIEFIEEGLEVADSHFFSLGGDVLEWVRLSKRSDSAKFLKKLRERIGNISTGDLAINVFNATVPTAALFSKAVAQAVDYFLEDANEMVRTEIIRLYRSNAKDAAAKIMGFVREALRLRPIFAGVYRTAVQPVPAENIHVGDWVFVDIATANNSLGQAADYARPVGKQGILTPYEDGLLTPKFFDAVVPVIVGTILSQKGLKRAVGESGKLTKFAEVWHGSKQEEYVNTSGLVTPWPDAMIVEF